jgi:hypothetical protein
MEMAIASPFNRPEHETNILQTLRIITHSLGSVQRPSLTHPSCPDPSFPTHPRSGRRFPMFKNFQQNFDKHLAMIRKSIHPLGVGLSVRLGGFVPQCSGFRIDLDDLLLKWDSKFELARCTEQLGSECKTIRVMTGRLEI